LEQARSTQRHRPIHTEEEDALTRSIILLASQYGRYGYRRITALLKHAGWHINHKRVERIWREQGLKVPQKQAKRRRLWLNDGSCVRLKPCRPNHVWSYDFVADRTFDGRPLKILTVLDEYSRECLAIDVERSLQSIDVLERLAELFVERGLPEYIRSPTTVRNLLRLSSVRGCNDLVWGPCSLNREVRGKTGMWNPLTASCGMNA